MRQAVGARPHLACREGGTERAHGVAARSARGRALARMPTTPQDSSLPRPGQPWWTQKTKPAQVPRPVVRCSPDEFYQAQLDWRSSQLQQVLDKRQAAEDAADAAAASPRRSRAAPDGASPAAGPQSGARVPWSEGGAGKMSATQPRPAAAHTPNAGERRTGRGPGTPGGVVSVDGGVDGGRGARRGGGGGGGAVRDHGRRGAA